MYPSEGTVRGRFSNRCDLGAGGLRLQAVPRGESDYVFSTRGGPFQGWNYAMLSLDHRITIAEPRGLSCAICGWKVRTKCLGSWSAIQRLKDPQPARTYTRTYSFLGISIRGGKPKRGYLWQYHGVPSNSTVALHAQSVEAGRRSAAMACTQPAR
jgi:hypothetical protein